MALLASYLSLSLQDDAVVGVSRLCGMCDFRPLILSVRREESGEADREPESKEDIDHPGGTRGMHLAAVKNKKNLLRCLEFQESWAAKRGVDLFQELLHGAERTHAQARVLLIGNAVALRHSRAFCCCATHERHDLLTCTMSDRSLISNRSSWPAVRLRASCRGPAHEARLGRS